MKRTLATLATIIAVSAPASAEAILGAGECTEVLPLQIEVQPGDTLIGIAEAYYDDWFFYRDIAIFNRVKDPNRILAGQVLELPYLTYERVRPVSISDGSPHGKYCRKY